MIAGHFPKVFSRAHFRLADNVRKILWRLVTTVAYVRKHALNQI